MDSLTTRLQQLEKKDPDLAERLSQVLLCRYTSCTTRQGEPNISREIDGKAVPLHSNYSAVKEAEKWFSGLELIHEERTIYLYGLGLGYALEPLKGWLAEDRRRMVVVLEEDPEVICHALTGPYGEQLATDDQILLCYLSMGQDQERQAVAHELAYFFVGVPFKVTALPYYVKYHRKTFDRMHMHLMHAAAYVNFASKEFLDYGAAFFRNFYVNLMRLPELTRCGPLFGAFEGVPAIICGAGPSLNKNFDVLRTLKDHALIFAGGSGINAVRSRGLEPHFGGSVDPNPVQAERMLAHSAFTMPTFTKGRVFFKALENLHGPRLYLTGNNGYPITKWIEKELGIEEPEMTEGHNVLHLLIDIAVHMKCNPIIFVGMDLAFSGLHQYAEGVVEESKVSEESITKASNINDNAFQRTDINGNKVYTLWKWVAESDYTSQYAKNHPEVTFINATEGGLGFDGIPNLTLAEVVQEYCRDPRDLESEIHALLQHGEMKGVTSERVFDLLNEIRKGLNSSIETCSDLEKMLDELQKRIKQGNAGRMEAASAKITDLQEQLSAEMVYKYLLEPVNHVRSNLFDRRLSEIEREGGSDLQKMLSRCEANLREIETVKECAQINCTIMDLAVAEYARQGNDVSGFKEEHE